MVTVAGNTSETGKYNRINATYGNGPDQLVQTIEANFGIPIDHVVQVDFEGSGGRVDAIGGINLDFPYPAKDTYTGLDITQPGASTSTAATPWPWPAAATTSTTRTATGSTTAPATSGGSSVRTPS